MLNTIDNTPATSSKSNMELLEIMDEPLRNLRPDFGRFRNISQSYSFHESYIHKPPAIEKKKQMMCIGNYSVEDNIKLK